MPVVGDSPIMRYKDIVPQTRTGEHANELYERRSPSHGGSGPPSVCLDIILLEPLKSAPEGFECRMSGPGSILGRERQAVPP